MESSPALKETPEALYFASYCLDLRGGRLLRAGEPIPLRPKTWAVLLYLLQRPGVLISKEDLLDAIWPDVAVTPDTLTKSIGELRVALDDDSRAPRCIETVHRRGFRFIAETTAQARVEEPSPLRRGSGRGVLVGRSAELARLDDLFARAARGSRQIAFVTGFAGVGKTEVVEAFAQSLRAASPSTWIGRGACIEQHGPREAYMPVLDALERLARRVDGERLIELLHRTAPTWLAQMPWLIGDRAEELRASLHAARPERMLREIGALLEELTVETPLVLVLEDLHWSDPSTVDLLSVLGGRSEAARLLVVATYRPAEVAVQEHVLGSAVRALRSRHRCVEIPLHELSLHDVQLYLELRFPGAGFAAALAPVVHEYTDGNALFTVAVVDHIVSRGWILETDPGWALAIDPRQSALGVPEDARHMIEMQLGNLSPGDRALLEAASLAGPDFTVRAVAAAIGEEAEEVETRCEGLARAHRFLRPGSTASWPDGGISRVFSFVHELYRQAAHAQISPSRRQRMHQRLGEALEAGYGRRADEIAPTLATHFAEARDLPRAVHYLAAAATRSLQRFAWREAIGSLTSALALTAQFPEGEERQRRELELRLAMAQPLGDAHGFASQQARQNSERAYALSLAVGTAASTFQVVYGLCHSYVLYSDLALAEEFGARIDELATRLGTPQHRLLADTAQTRIATLGGRFVDACRLAEERLLAPCAGRIVAPFSFGADALLGALSMYALSLWFVGRPARAKEISRDSQEAAEKQATPFTRVAILGHRCLLDAISLDAAELGVHSERVVTLAAEHGFAYWHAVGRAFRGWAWVQEGHLDEGIRELEQGLTALQATGARLLGTHLRAFLAEAHLRGGEAARGLVVIDEALELARTGFDRSYWPELWRLKGELLLAAKPRRRGARKAAPSSEGVDCILRAVEQARASQARALELRAATSLMRARKGQAGSAEARRALADLCEWFGAIDSPDLAAARAML